MRHKIAIEEKHTFAMMRAYICGERFLCLSYKDAFFADPVQESKDARSKRFIVTVDVRRHHKLTP
jgi:hypothetical protein